MNEDIKPDAIPSRAEWSTPQKICVKTLHDEAGWSIDAIAREVYIPRSTVQGFLRSTNLRQDGKNYPGGPKMLTTSEVDKLVEMVTQHGERMMEAYEKKGLATKF